MVHLLLADYFGGHERAAHFMRRFAGITLKIPSVRATEKILSKARNLRVTPELSKLNLRLMTRVRCLDNRNQHYRNRPPSLRSGLRDCPGQEYLFLPKKK